MWGIARFLIATAAGAGLGAGAALARRHLLVPSNATAPAWPGAESPASFGSTEPGQAMATAHSPAAAGPPVSAAAHSDVADLEAARARLRERAAALRAEMERSAR